MSGFKELTLAATLAPDQLDNSGNSVDFNEESSSPYDSFQEEHRSELDKIPLENEELEALYFVATDYFFQKDLVEKQAIDPRKLEEFNNKLREVYVRNRLEPSSRYLSELSDLDPEILFGILKANQRPPHENIVKRKGYTPTIPQNLPGKMNALLFIYLHERSDEVAVQIIEGEKYYNNEPAPALNRIYREFDEIKKHLEANPYISNSLKEEVKSNQTTEEKIPWVQPEGPSEPDIEKGRIFFRKHEVIQMYFLAGGDIRRDVDSARSFMVKNLTNEGQIFIDESEGLTPGICYRSAKKLEKKINENSRARNSGNKIPHTDVDTGKDYRELVRKLYGLAEPHIRALVRSADGDAAYYENEMKNYLSVGDAYYQDVGYTAGAYMADAQRESGRFASLNNGNPYRNANIGVPHQSGTEN